MKHSAKLMALAISLGLTLAASTSNAQEVVVGVFVPTTGNWAAIGTDMRNGLELAAQGAKVKGQPVRLIVEDTAGNPQTGLKKAQKLKVEDKAVLLIGGASSAVTLAINAQADRLNVPIITTNGQAVAITGDKCSKYLFRTVPNDALAAKGTTVLMQQRKDLLAKKWFVVYHDFVYGHSNKAEFAKVPGIKIVGEAGRPLGTADWSSAISQIQASSADGVYLALAVGDDLTAFVNQLRGFGINHSLIVPVGIPDSMLQALGKNGVGMVTGGLTASWTQEDSNSQVADFVKAYVAKYKVVPGYQAINAYAGMQLTLAALNASSDMSTDSIIKALESTSADTILGKLKIRKEDHQAMIGSYIAEAQALPAPKYGASVAWKTSTPIGWDQIKYAPTELGCKGL
jgi:branched-chain amino acid transport system substrate-binding protein